MLRQRGSAIAGQPVQLKTELAPTTPSQTAEEDAGDTGWKGPQHKCPRPLPFPRLPVSSDSDVYSSKKLNNMQIMMQLVVLPVNSIIIVVYLV